MCSCEFYKVSKNTFFTEHLWTTASVNSSKLKKITIKSVSINNWSKYFRKLQQKAFTVIGCGFQ